MPIQESFLWFILSFILTSNGSDHPTGHLQPLGSHQPPVGEVLSVDEIPSPQEFFQKYLQPGKPVLFKGAATKIPAYKLWTDDYLSLKYGDLVVDVEEGKKENRSNELFNMPFKLFLKIYNESDVYLVHSLPKAMRDEMFLLRCLLCGGYTDGLQDSVMWFSNGGTKSVLHFDAIDNINCLMSGSKDLFMVDKREKAHINIDSPKGSFSKVDVDKVDLYKYPGLADVPWYKGRMEPGDCLFIPYRWFHQVRSYGPRNLAINIWFRHQFTFNSTDCDNSPHKNKEFAPLSAFEISQNLEENMGVMLVDEMEGKAVNEAKWLEIWKNLWLGEKDEHIDKASDIVQNIFRTFDTNKDSLVSPDEVILEKLEEFEEQLAEVFPKDGGEEADEEDEDEGEREEGGREEEGEGGGREEEGEREGEDEEEGEEGGGREGEDEEEGGGREGGGEGREGEDEEEGGGREGEGGEGGGEGREEEEENEDEEIEENDHDKETYPHIKHDDL